MIRFVRRFIGTGQVTSGRFKFFEREKKKGEDSELRSCVKVEVDVLGSPSLTVCTVSVDVKQHRRRVGRRKRRKEKKKHLSVKF